MKKQLLKSRIMAAGHTQAKTAEILGISERAFSAKLNGYKGADFRQKEIEKIRDAYHLSQQETIDIFFE